MVYCTHEKLKLRQGDIIEERRVGKECVVLRSKGDKCADERQVTYMGIVVSISSNTLSVCR